jgi:Mce-associated membrane protein
VAIAGVGGWLYWNRVELRGEQVTRDELAPLAAKQIPQVLGYDYQTVERSLNLSAQRNSASVMVYMNRTVTDKSKTPIYDGSRLRVDYQKIDGKWLIKYITPI